VQKKAQEGSTAAQHRLRAEGNGRDEVRIGQYEKAFERFSVNLIDRIQVVAEAEKKISDATAKWGHPH
jgi:hypothetical protein